MAKKDSLPRRSAADRPSGAKAGSPDDANPGGLRSAAPFVPATKSVRVLSSAAEGCRGCDLYKAATQVVFGAGPGTARVIVVGEQPGDQEDLHGEPFVGPAGALLHKALEEAGIPRAAAYLTNAVKHFKWEPRGKRRIHKKPRASEIKACRPWLEAELTAIKPAVVVCLGATAAQSVLGSQFKLMQNRGKVLPGAPLGAAAGARVVATIHPSAVLRAPDSEGRHAAYTMLVDDLKVVAKLLRNS
jgi:DNA polymerase